MRRMLAAGLWLAANAFSGCTYYLPHQVVSSNVPLNPPSYKVIGPAQGQGCAVLIFGGWPVGKGNNRLQAAIDDALGKSGGDALVEMTTDISLTNYGFGYKLCTLVNGLAIKRERR